MGEEETLNRGAPNPSWELTPQLTAGRHEQEQPLGTSTCPWWLPGTTPDPCGTLPAQQGPNTRSSRRGAPRGARCGAAALPTCHH